MQSTCSTSRLGLIPDDGRTYARMEIFVVCHDLVDPTSYTSSAPSYNLSLFPFLSLLPLPCVAVDGETWQTCWIFYSCWFSGIRPGINHVQMLNFNKRLAWLTVRKLTDLHHILLTAEENFLFHVNRSRHSALIGKK